MNCWCCGPWCLNSQGMPAALGVPHVSGLVVKLMSAVFLDRYGKFPDRKLSLYRHCFLLHSFIYVCVCVCPCAMEVRGQLAIDSPLLPRGSWELCLELGGKFAKPPYQSFLTNANLLADCWGHRGPYAHRSPVNPEGWGWMWLTSW